MKKLLALLIALLVLTGCGKGYSKINNGDDVIFTDGKTPYTKQDLYKVLKVSSESAIETDILNKIADNLEIDRNKIEETVDETLEMYASIGYDQETLNSYRDYLISDGILIELGKIYVSDHFDELVEKDVPVLMQMAYFSDEETANKFIEQVKNGSTFESAAAENGYGNNCSTAVYTDTDNLPIDVKDYLNKTDTTGLSPIITYTVSSTDADGNINDTNTYYVLNVSSKNVEDYKDDYIEKRASETSEDMIKEYFFETHEIKFYDQDIYEMMKAKYEVLK